MPGTEAVQYRRNLNDLILGPLNTPREGIYKFPRCASTVHIQPASHYLEDWTNVHMRYMYLTRARASQAAAGLFHHFNSLLSSPFSAIMKLELRTRLEAKVRKYRGSETPRLPEHRLYVLTTSSNFRFLSVIWIIEGDVNDPDRTWMYTSMCFGSAGLA